MPSFSFSGSTYRSLPPRKTLILCFPSQCTRLLRVQFLAVGRLFSVVSVGDVGIGGWCRWWPQELLRAKLELAQIVGTLEKVSFDGEIAVGVPGPCGTH